MVPRGLKSISGPKMNPGGKKSKFHFSTKIGQKMVPTDLKSIFALKMKNSIFRPKMCPGAQKSVFGKKNQKFNF